MDVPHIDSGSKNRGMYMCIYTDIYGYVWVYVHVVGRR
jgi:hypothetical protein